MSPHVSRDQIEALAFRTGREIELGADGSASLRVGSTVYGSGPERPDPRVNHQPSWADTDSDARYVMDAEDQAQYDRDDQRTEAWG
jgi:hypothetical protein